MAEKALIRQGPALWAGGWAAFLCGVFALCLAGVGTLAADEGYRRISRAQDLSHVSGKIGTYTALVIGIDDYADGRIPDLKTAVSDARAVAKTLSERYGFKDILVLTDKAATASAINNALRERIKGLGRDDSLVVYYAGHGELDRLTGDGWWLPWDARLGVVTTYLENTTVQKYVRAMKARHVLLVSDSCYSGALFGESRDLPPVIDDRFYLDLYNERSRWAMTSGNKTPVSDRGFGGHSVFAYPFLRKLQKNANRYMTPREIYMDIGPVVRNNSEQMPLCRPIKNTGDLGGEFVFLLAGAGGAVVTEPAAGTNLSVECNVRGAVVVLGGQEVGRTPVEKLEVPPGERVLEVSKPGYEAYRKRVSLAAGESASVYVTLMPEQPAKGRLFVQVEPGDARVRILNIAPVFYQGMELDAGRYRLEVSAENHATRIEWIELAGGEDKTVSIRLDAVAVGRRAGDEWTEPVTGMEFVWVRGGCYEMGCGSWTGDCYSDESPVHEVCVDGFWMGKYEVTQGQWVKVMGENPSRFKKGDSHPVESVSWEDVKKYIEKLNARSGGGYTLRLPTEAEWEYACRSGGKREKYSGGDDVDRVAWYSGNSGGSTHRVGTKAANGLGIHDMSGNVWEWCEDIYDSDAYSKHQRNNPIYTEGGSDRVIRGGSWGDVAGGVRCARRSDYTPGDRGDDLGFRLLRSK